MTARKSPSPTEAETWPDNDGYVGPSPDELAAMMADLELRVIQLESITSTMRLYTDCTCKAPERHSAYHEPWCPVEPHITHESTTIEFGDGGPF